MPAPSDNGNGHTNGNGTKPRQPAVAAEEQSPAGIAGLLAEAQALKESLRDCYGRTSRLVAALTHYRRQSKAVASTLATLRQLPNIAP